jgi:nucleoid-associated protein YejK
MFVVDVHALQPVNFLNFVDEIFLQFFLAADIQIPAIRSTARLRLTRFAGFVAGLNGGWIERRLD